MPDSKKRSRDAVSSESLFTIQPVKSKTTKEDRKPILGRELLPGLPLYFNSFLAAPTGSGKTTMLHHLLQHTIDERTTVYIFCSTYDIDSVWIAIIKMLEDKGCMVHKFHDLQVEKVSLLKPLFQELSKEESESKDAPPKPSKILLTSNPDLPPDDKPKRNKVYSTRAPKRLLLIDDADINALRGTELCNILKKCRHFKTRCYVVSQHPIHLSPSAFDQLSVLYLWPGFSQHYIEMVWSRIVTRLSKEEFWQLYSLVSEVPYQFLTCQLRSRQFFIGLRPDPLEIKNLFA